MSDFFCRVGQAIELEAPSGLDKIMATFFEESNPNELYIWIDAICIDQKNPLEKTTQIPLMGEVYNNAELVLAWLGNDTRYLKTFTWMHTKFLSAMQEHVDK